MKTAEERLMDLAWKVYNMREAQKAYFRSRDRNELVKSKQLEIEVDNMVDFELFKTRNA